MSPLIVLRGPCRLDDGLRCPDDPAYPSDFRIWTSVST
jgi:hypothetical protein